MFTTEDAQYSSPFAGRTTKILGRKASFRCSALHECNGDDTVSARVCHQSTRECMSPFLSSNPGSTVPPCLRTKRSSTARLVSIRAPQPQGSDTSLGKMDRKGHISYSKGVRKSSQAQDDMYLTIQVHRIVPILTSWAITTANPQISMHLLPLLILDHQTPHPALNPFRPLLLQPPLPPLLPPRVILCRQRRRIPHPPRNALRPLRPNLLLVRVIFSPPLARRGLLLLACVTAVGNCCSRRRCAG